MGTDGELITEMLRGRGFLEGRREFPSSFRGSGFYTALSAVMAAEAALARRGRTLRGLRVAVEGFGAVGASAARLVHARGARVVAVSTSAGAVHRSDGLNMQAIGRVKSPIEADPRAHPIPIPDLLRLEVDVLLLCGPGATVDAGVAREVQASVVSPGANCAYSIEAIEVLNERGITALPDFVANCGGIVSPSLRVTGVPEAGIEAFFRTVYRWRVSALLTRSAETRRPPTEVALATLQPLRGAGAPRENRSILSAVRSVVRGRLVPRAMLAGPALVYFASRIGRPADGAYAARIRSELTGFRLRGTSSAAAVVARDECLSQGRGIPLLDLNARVP